MSNRCVVNVATGAHYQRGQKRLRENLLASGTEFMMWGAIPEAWPTHEQKPYAMKAYAMKYAEDRGCDTLLWCDASILPVADMTPLWERIERDGYWFARNGYTNYEWTADSAYPDLFPHLGDRLYARVVNRGIAHVVATAFGISMKHEIGRAFLKEYYRLASETNAFCGPWINARKGIDGASPRVAACGPPDVLGHRHDQTAASVIAWRLDMKLVDPPEIFAYGRADEAHDPRTILLASGEYE